MFRQIRALVYKEFLHIIRDWRTALIILILPAIMILIFGFALSTEIKGGSVGVVDFANTQKNREIIDRIGANTYIGNVTIYNTVDGAIKTLQNSTNDIIVVFPAEGNKIQLLTDASDLNKGKIIVGYLNGIINSSINNPTKNSIKKPVNTSITFLYNPKLESAYNFVPGVMGLILMLICAMMTSVAIVKEKETGTIDLISISPVKPFTTILAKIIPYFIISCIDFDIILLMSRYLLHVPINGNIFLLFGFSFLFILTALSIGIFISTIVKSQAAALIGSGMILMMPTIILSGMLFPIESMPTILQGVSILIPARWFIDGIREIMIKGSGIYSIITNIFILLAMSILLLTISYLKLRKVAK